MTATRDQARDECAALFKAAWDPRAAVWTDKPDPTPASGVWARFAMNHVTQGQGSLANDSGRKRWTSTGFITVQVFTPVGDGLRQSDALSKIVVAAFRGKHTSPGEVWFRNVRAVEIGPDGEFYQVNVLADFEYDEVA